MSHHSSSGNESDRSGTNTVGRSPRKTPPSAAGSGVVSSRNSPGSGQSNVVIHQTRTSALRERSSSRGQGNRDSFQRGAAERGSNSSTGSSVRYANKKAKHKCSTYTSVVHINVHFFCQCVLMDFKVMHTDVFESFILIAYQWWINCQYASRECAPFNWSDTFLGSFVWPCKAHLNFWRVALEKDFMSLIEFSTLRRWELLGLNFNAT